MLSYSTRLISIRHVHLWRPPTDIYETETQLVVQIEIAGMRDGDVSILCKIVVSPSAACVMSMHASAILIIRWRSTAVNLRSKLSCRWRYPLRGSTLNTRTGF